MRGGGEVIPIEIFVIWNPLVLLDKPIDHVDADLSLVCLSFLNSYDNENDNKNHNKNLYCTFQEDRVIYTDPIF